jgi:epoxyqueuosine reductase
MDRAALTTRLKQEARRLGFDLAGACPAVSPRGIDRLHEWLAVGYAGEMGYLTDRAAAYDHPRHVLDGVRSLLVLAMNYRTSDPAPVAAGQGRISRYAWGRDYHDIIHDRLKALAAGLRDLVPTARVRGVVDTAPLLEREFAELSGLGWIGKNTLVLNRSLGSWFFLAVLLTDVELDYDEPNATDYCGTCTACLDACPTQAFVAPYVLDARRCISYLTIELRSPIPTELRAGVGDWVFGCDVCQDVCPWNHRAPHSELADLAPVVGTNPLDLIAILDLSEAECRELFRHTPMWRAKRRGLLRNAAVVLGNQRCEQALPGLIRSLDDDEPLVRGACAWAVGRFDDPQAADALRQRLAAEPDADVRAELTAAHQAASAHSASSATAPSGPAGA